MTNRGWIMVAAAAFVLVLSGCRVGLTGAGEAGVGYSSTSKVFVYHTVDGDKVGKESNAEVDPTPIVDLIISIRKARNGETPANGDRPVVPPGG